MSVYMLDVWYRHEEDADQSVRPGPQMMAPSDSAEQSARILRELQAQGYRLQRAIRRTLCGACDGSGVVWLRRKGARKAAPVSLRTHRQAPCEACDGGGDVGSFDLAIGASDPTMERDALGL
jgi:hypothetical protein